MRDLAKRWTDLGEGVQPLPEFLALLHFVWLQVYFVSCVQDNGDWFYTLNKYYRWYFCTFQLETISFRARHDGFLLHQMETRTKGPTEPSHRTKCSLACLFNQQTLICPSLYATHTVPDSSPDSANGCVELGGDLEKKPKWMRFCNFIWVLNTLSATSSSLMSPGLDPNTFPSCFQKYLQSLIKHLQGSWRSGGRNELIT